MSTDPKEPPAPYEVLVAIKATVGSHGWGFICAEFDQRLTTLTERMHDLKTAPIEAEQMRQARGRIVRDFSPQVIADQMVAKLGGKLIPKTQ
jgi:hypothetical protein